MKKAIISFVLILLLFLPGCLNETIERSPNDIDMPTYGELKLEISPPNITLNNVNESFNIELYFISNTTNEIKLPKVLYAHPGSDFTFYIQVGSMLTGYGTPTANYVLSDNWEDNIILKANERYNYSYPLRISNFTMYPETFFSLTNTTFEGRPSVSLQLYIPIENLNQGGSHFMSSNIINISLMKK